MICLSGSSRVSTLDDQIVAVLENGCRLPSREPFHGQIWRGICVARSHASVSQGKKNGRAAGWHRERARTQWQSSGEIWVWLQSAQPPLWLLTGAWFFGALMYLSLYVQALGVPVPSALLSALPYIGTVVVLVLISRDTRRIRLHRPAMLGRPFQAKGVGQKTLQKRGSSEAVVSLGRNTCRKGTS